MKRIIALIFIFLIYTGVVNFCPAVTAWDESFILRLQYLLRDLPLIIPLLPDCKLYTLMIVFPLLLGSWGFIRQRNFLSAAVLCSVPLVTFLLNCIIKPLVHRARPPFEMQPAIHPHSFSYVSSHSLVTFCLWGIVIYLLQKYCPNKYLRYFGIILSVLWILFVGISRIWLGVHNPSDVVGAYILGGILVTAYVALFKFVEGR